MVKLVHHVILPQDFLKQGKLKMKLWTESEFKLSTQIIFKVSILPIQHVEELDRAEHQFYKNIFGTNMRKKIKIIFHYLCQTNSKIKLSTP